MTSQKECQTCVSDAPSQNFEYYHKPPFSLGPAQIIFQKTQCTYAEKISHIHVHMYESEMNTL